jgi:opacity protein-like surface antigen
MKKLLFVGVFAASIVANTKVNAQAVEQGNIIIDPYYGGPNFGKAFAEGIGGTSTDLKVKGLGPLGLRAEYMVADKFGVGFDFIYNSFSLNTTADSLNNDGTVFQTYDVKANLSRVRLQARFNYHFIENDNVDAYFGVGAGTNFRKYTLTTDYPNYEDESETGTLLPFSLRLAVGTRYYFTENIGINAEIGIGGPVLSGGISIKF